ncbi:MAG: hypothetical protein EOO38_28185 [Cytophagaceae bacterium]|nr:MAG: hypothetical protein EOO38_28185 [Cytophagaceae bacterium]
MDEVNLTIIRSGVTGIAVGALIILLKIFDLRRTPEVKEGERGIETQVVGISFVLIVFCWLAVWMRFSRSPEIWVFLVPVTLAVVAWLVILGLQLPGDNADIENYLDSDADLDSKQLAVVAVSPQTFAIDGSNIASLQGFEPSLATSIARELTAKGHKVRLFFDANVGFRATGSRHLTNDELSALYDFPAENITIVPGGTAADPWILRWALHNDVTVISNDQYRDHRDYFSSFDFALKLEKAVLIDEDIWLERATAPITYKRSMGPEA